MPRKKPKENARKTVKLTESTYARLLTFGKMGESMDQVVARLIAFYVTHVELKARSP